jgi:hypothetical protein
MGIPFDMRGFLSCISKVRGMVKPLHLIRNEADLFPYPVNGCSALMTTAIFKIIAPDGKPESLDE